MWLFNNWLYADNLDCVSRDLAVLLRTARFTTGYVRLVGQELAPSKCVLVRASKVVRRGMRDWTLTNEGDRWTVKLDVRTLVGTGIPLFGVVLQGSLILCGSYDECKRCSGLRFGERFIRPLSVRWRDRLV